MKSKKKSELYMDYLFRNYTSFLNSFLKWLFSFYNDLMLFKGIEIVIEGYKFRINQGDVDIKKNKVFLFKNNEKTVQNIEDIFNKIFNYINKNLLSNQTWRYLNDILEDSLIELYLIYNEDDLSSKSFIRKYWKKLTFNERELDKEEKRIGFSRYRLLINVKDFYKTYDNYLLNESKLDKETRNIFLNLLFNNIWVENTSNKQNTPNLNDVLNFFDQNTEKTFFSVTRTISRPFTLKKDSNSLLFTKYLNLISLFGELDIKNYLNLNRKEVENVLMSKVFFKDIMSPFLEVFWTYEDYNKISISKWELSSQEIFKSLIGSLFDNDYNFNLSAHESNQHLSKVVFWELDKYIVWSFSIEDLRKEYKNYFSLPYELLVKLYISSYFQNYFEQSKLFLYKNSLYNIYYKRYVTHENKDTIESFNYKIYLQEKKLWSLRYKKLKEKLSLWLTYYYPKINNLSQSNFLKYKENPLFTDLGIFTDRKSLVNENTYFNASATAFFSNKTSIKDLLVYKLLNLKTKERLKILTKYKIQYFLKINKLIEDSWIFYPFNELDFISFTNIDEEHLSLLRKKLDSLISIRKFFYLQLEKDSQKYPVLKHILKEIQQTKLNLPILVKITEKRDNEELKRRENEKKRKKLENEIYKLRKNSSKDPTLLNKYQKELDEVNSSKKTTYFPINNLTQEDLQKKVELERPKILYLSNSPLLKWRLKRKFQSKSSWTNNISDLYCQVSFTDFFYREGIMKIGLKNQISEENKSLFFNETNELYKLLNTLLLYMLYKSYNGISYYYYKQVEYLVDSYYETFLKRVSSETIHDTLLTFPFPHFFELVYLHEENPDLRGGGKIEIVDLCNQVIKYYEEIKFYKNQLIRRVHWIKEINWVKYYLQNIRISFENTSKMKYELSYRWSTEGRRLHHYQTITKEELDSLIKTFCPIELDRKTEYNLELLSEYCNCLKEYIRKDIQTERDNIYNILSKGTWLDWYIKKIFDSYKKLEDETNKLYLLKKGWRARCDSYQVEEFFRVFYKNLGELPTTLTNNKNIEPILWSFLTNYFDLYNRKDKKVLLTDKEYISNYYVEYNFKKKLSPIIDYLKDCLGKYSLNELGYLSEWKKLYHHLKINKLLWFLDDDLCLLENRKSFDKKSRKIFAKDFNNLLTLLKKYKKNTDTFIRYKFKITSSISPEHVLCGSYSNCCMTLWSQVLEDSIYEKWYSILTIYENNIPVWNALIFLAYIKGKKCLVLDNIELRKLSSHKRKLWIIRKELEHYLRILKGEFGCKKFYIWTSYNDLWYNVYIDIEQKEFKPIWFSLNTKYKLNEDYGNEEIAPFQDLITRNRKKIKENSKSLWEIFFKSYYSDISKMGSRILLYEEWLKVRENLDYDDE